MADGGAAVLLMSQEKARQLGYPADTVLKAWRYTALDPMPAGLLAPVLGWGPCLAQCGASLKDVDLFEIHEGFAAQLLAMLKVVGSEEWARRVFGHVLGDVPSICIDPSRVNPQGGSIAFGHVMGGTAIRLIFSISPIAASHKDEKFFAAG